MRPSVSQLTAGAAHPWATHHAPTFQNTGSWAVFTIWNWLAHANNGRVARQRYQPEIVPNTYFKNVYVCQMTEEVRTCHPILGSGSSFVDYTNLEDQIAGTTIDLFAGAGGVTTGFKKAGASVLAAIELNRNSAATYRLNHSEVLMFNTDINEVEPKELARKLDLGAGELANLAACAPCQGFSSLGPRRPDDPRNDLVLRVLDFVAHLRPHTVAFENVPQLQYDDRLKAFIEGLHALNYGVKARVIDAANTNVPQRRKRLVVLAAHDWTDSDVATTLSAGVDNPESRQVRWVRHALDGLGQLDDGDHLHVSRRYPSHVLARIRAVPKDGGSRRDLPPDMWLRCHENLTGGAASAYGRMRWNDVSPTLTTRCTSPSCGRFLHPEEDRTITLREAAALQTFPSKQGEEDQYQFFGGRMSVEAQIGNAVPVDLAAAIWRALGPANG